MPGAYVPPWLNVQPSDFVQAATAGGRLGAQLAALANERNIADARNATALQEAQMRESTAMSGQQAEAGLAQSRLEQASKQQEAERRLKEWEIQQQIQHQQNALEAENTRAANALGERSQYGQSMLDIRREANRIAQERADNAASKPSPSDFVTETEHTKEVPPNKMYDITKPGVFNWFSANTPPSSLSTTNVSDLQNLPRGSSIVTNTIPGTGTPAKTFSRRVPIDQSPYALPGNDGTNTPASTPLSPLEGKQVRHKGTGQVGTIINGEFVPDQTGNQDEM